MLGSHCLKTWSKTQALIAKSSGEAELYAVVKGAAEAIGMSTLARDLGRRVGIQLHIDALAAKGMIERKGLSKVRHLDVNVLWLQEQCARKILPVTKVPGEDNMADLMTKHLGAAKIKKNIESMKMSFVEGRATKAAQLHAVDMSNEVANSRAATSDAQPMGDEDGGDGRAIWDCMGDRFVDKRGGDYWKNRGEHGVWHRIHAKPRRSLFTPYKVAKGPSSKESLNGIRFTKGVTQSGHKFEFHDRWQNSDNAHKILDESWIGCTTFIREDQISLLEAQHGDPGETRRGTATRLSWEEIIE